jgi:peptide/nickel transport system permease protein
MSATIDVAEAVLHVPRERAFPTGIGRTRVLLWIGIILTAIPILAGIFAPFLSPYDPTAQDLFHTLAPPFSSGHLLGTDQFGRDSLSRILYAGRIDALIAFGATGVTFVVGSVLGLISGYYGGWVDRIVMRVVDVFFAFPFLVLVLVVIAMLGPGLLNMFIAIWLTSWPPYTRLVRGEVLVAKREEYVLAARTLGYGDMRIMFGHLLVNVIMPALVFAMIGCVYNLGLGAFLGYLGLGVQDPLVEWGKMIADSKTFMLTNWWLPTFPGIVVVIFGLGLSLIGDALSSIIRADD